MTRKSEVTLGAQSIYTFRVLGSDKGIPGRSSTATVRIDSFPADLAMIVINMNIDRSTFAQSEADFLSKVRMFQDVSISAKSYDQCVIYV